VSLPPAPDYVTLCVEGAKYTKKYSYMTAGRCGNVDRDANGGLCNNRRGAIAWEVLQSQTSPDVCDRAAACTVWPLIPWLPCQKIKVSSFCARACCD